MLRFRNWQRCFTVIMVWTFALSKTAAQSPPFRQIGPANGLPGTFVYGTSQDAEGYLWFATPRGAVRFDGQHCESFTLADGLAGIEILACVPDHVGRVWFLGHKVKPAFYKRGEIHILEHLPLRAEESIVRFLAHASGEAWLLTSQRLFRIVEDEQLEEIHTFSSGVPIITIMEDSVGQDWFFCEDSIYGIRPNDTLVVPWPNGLKPDQKQVKAISGPNGKFWIWGSEIGTFWFDSRNLEWSQVDLDYDKDEGLMHKFAFDQLGRLWATNGNGVILFGKDQKVSRHIFPEIRVMSIFFDKDNHLWISTPSEGLKMVGAPVLGTLKWQPSDGLPGIKVTAMAKDSVGSIWMGFENGNVAVMSEGKVHSIYFEPLRKTSQTVRQIWTASDGAVWVAGANGLHGFNSMKEVRSIPIPDVKAILFDDSGTCWVGTSSQLLAIPSNQLASFGKQRIEQSIPPIHANISLQKSLSIQSVPLGAYALALVDGGIKVGNAGGTWILGDSLVTDPILENVPISFLLGLKQKQQWIGTGGKGLWLFSGQKKRHLGMSDGLSGDDIQMVAKGKEGRVWVGSSRGVDLFNNRNREFGKLNPSHPTILNPLMGREVFCLLEQGDYLYAGTNEGLFQVSLSALDWKGAEPITRLDHIEVMGQNIGVPAKLELSAGENDLSLHLKTVLSTGHELLRYQYRLLGAFNEFQEHLEPEIRFYQLTPGKYIFECYPSYPGSSAEGSMIRYAFVIHPFWYQRTGIQVGIFLLVLFTMLGIGWWRWNETRKTLDLKNRILDVKHQALLAQMNPHFIFNVMNAVQALISEGDPIAANQVLVRISRLIRKVLDYARTPTLSLQEEMEFLELYFSLEAIRFSEGIQLKFSIDPAIDPYETYIPSMLLQPIVENALRHAFPQGYKQGIVKVSFRLWEDQLLCEIQDNGIGRMKAAALRSSGNENGHISHGLALTRERLSILSHRSGANYALEIVDLKDRQAVPAGTLVKITLPRL